MSSTALGRRLRKLETALGSEDIRQYLHRPLVEWPDSILELAIALGEEELAKLTANGSAESKSREPCGSQSGWDQSS